MEFKPSPLSMVAHLRPSDDGPQVLKYLVQEVFKEVLPIEGETPITMH
jgi:hypothetical protein